MRNVLAQGLGRVLALLASFTTFVIVARTFGAEQFGEFAFVMACVSLAGSFCDLGTTATVARLLPHVEHANGARASFIGDFLLLRAMLAIFVAPLAFLGFVMVKPELALAIGLGCLALPLASARFFEPLFQVYEAARYSVFTAFVYAFAQPAMALVLVVWLQVGLIGYLWGYLATQGLYVVVAVSLLLRLVVPRLRVDLGCMKTIMIAAAPLGVSAVFNTINTRADTLMLGYFRSSHEVGLYGAANRVLDLAIALGVSASLPLVPILSRKLTSDREKTRAACKRLLELLALGTLPIALVTPHISPQLMQLLYGAQYLEAAPVLDLFAWMFVLVGLAVLALSINLAAGKVQYTYWNTALGAAINLSLNAFLIPRFGILGAAWASLVSAGTMVLVAQFHLWRNLGCLFDLTRWTKIGGLVIGLYVALDWASTFGLIHLGSAVGFYAVATWAAGLLPVQLFRKFRHLGRPRNP